MLREATLLVSEKASLGVLGGELKRDPPMSGAIIDHSEIVDALPTDLELGDLASGFGKMPELLLPPPPLRGFFMADCALGKTMSFMLEQETI